MEKKNFLGYCLDLDMELFEFLRSHGSDRFTKLDAFCDLINRLPVTKMGDEYDSLKKLLPYESDTFRATITELAQSWHWHRATVRTFLDGLERLGYLSKELDGKEYIFKIRMFSNVIVPISPQDALRITMVAVIDKMFNSGLSDEQIATQLEENLKATFKTDETVTEENVQEKVAEMKTEFMKQAISILTYRFGHVITVDDDIFPLLYDACSGENAWSWTKMVKALRYLNINGYSIMPCENDKVQYVIDDTVELVDFTEDDLDTIHEIAAFIKALSETAGEEPEDGQVDAAEASSSPAIPTHE